MLEFTDGLSPLQGVLSPDVASSPAFKWWRILSCCFYFGKVCVVVRVVALCYHHAISCLQVGG